MSLKLSASVTSFLKKNKNKRFTARDIAEWLMETYPDQCRRKMERSGRLHTNAELLQQLVAEIGSIRPQMQKKTPGIKTTEDRPKEYYFTDDSDEDEIINTEKNSSPEGIKGGEYSLYPKLIEFMKTELKVLCMRIDEKRSRNACGPGGNKWLYPDITGMEDLNSAWIREVQDCVKEYSDKRTKLWSFEVKQQVNRSNVREAFFQAVSNSSWANFGYLVAGDITGTDTLNELRILTSLHGIGIIRLDKENPVESQLVIPARERIDVDWNTANRLATENSDFLSYIKKVTHFHQTGETKESDWDKGLF